MSHLSTLGITDGDITPRLRFVNLLPSALLIATVGALLLGGAPLEEPSFRTMVGNARAYGWIGGTAATAGVLVVALLLQPLELASIRLLEGYWRTTGPLGPVGRIGRWLQERRRSRLLWVLGRLQDHDSTLSQEAARELSLLPERGDVLPTTLGNRLRAAEERAGRPYGLDAIHTWPRLYYVLPQDAWRTVSDSRNQLDIAARLSITFGLISLISAGLLATHGWWLAVPAVFAILSWFAYRSAVEAATTYGVTFSAAIDVYRLQLLQIMRVEMPTDTEKEREINSKLTELWRRSGGLPPTVRYSTTDTDVGLRHGWNDR